MRRVRDGFALLTILACGIGRAEASGTYFRPDAHGLGQHTILDKGDHRLGLRADFQDYSRVRLRTGVYQNVRDVRLRTYAFTGEYALTQDSVLFGSVPVVDNDSAINMQEFAPYTGLGDAQFGYSRVHPLRETTSLLSTAQVRFPLSSYDTTRLTAPGDKSVDFILGLNYREVALFRSPLYLSAGGGFNLRSNSPNQWLWNAEIGRQVGRETSASLFVDSIDSISGEELGSPFFQGDFAKLKQTATRLGARVSFTVRGTDGVIYFAKSIRWQNQAPSDFYGLSLSRRF
jgi:hypothetical protein